MLSVYAGLTTISGGPRPGHKVSGIQSKVPNLNENGQKSHFFCEVFLTQNPVSILSRSATDDLVTHEELVGLYAVDNITSKTLVNSLKDVLLIRMGLSVQNCRGQCYEGANNMAGSKPGVATQIQRKEPRAILTHCSGHSLQLAVGDMVRAVRNLRDALDTTSEISKLLKFSPKRDRMFEKLKAKLAPETPGFRVLCPIRWTVRAALLQSVIDNWIPLQ